MSPHTVKNVGDPVGKLPPVRGLGPDYDLAGSYPSYMDEIKATLGDTDKSDDHVSFGDFNLKPECIGSAGALYQRLVRQVNVQDAWWEAVEAKDDTVDQFANIAIGLFACEVAQSAAYIAGAVATCYAVAAALGSATAAASVACSTGFAITNAVASVSSALLSAGSWLYDSVFNASEPKGSVAELLRVSGEMTTQSQSALSATDAVNDALTAYRATPAPTAYGCGILLGALGLLTGLQGVLDTLTLKNTISALNDLDDEWDGWRLALSRYQINATKARELLNEFDAAQQNCDENDDDNDDDAKKEPQQTRLARGPQRHRRPHRSGVRALGHGLADVGLHDPLRE